MRTGDSSEEVQKLNRMAVAGLIGGPALVVVALLLALWSARSDDDGEEDAVDPRPPTTLDARPNVGVEERVPISTTPSSTTTTTVFSEVEPAVSDPEVLLVVGQDIQPGRYLATDLTFTCYWERVSGLDGDFDQIIVNGLGGTSPGQGQLIVDILASDAGFRTQGCGDWRPYAPPATPATTMGDGDWLVGSDIQPGTYGSTGPPSSVPCHWERASGFTHDGLSEWIDSGFPEEPTTVQVYAGERFTADACGMWVLQP
jgi:hypothetical protein